MWFYVVTGKPSKELRAGRAVRPEGVRLEREPGGWETGDSGQPRPWWEENKP